MTKRSKRIWLTALTSVVLIAVTAVIVVRIPGYGPKDWLAVYLGEHLKSVPDDLVAAEMRQIATLDEVGLSILLDGLGSPRPSVAEAAAAILHEQLDGWTKLPRERSSRPVAIIARGLARRIDDWPVAARSAAADLALRILDWPIDNRQVLCATLIADCEHVLRVQQGRTVSAAGVVANVQHSPAEGTVSQEVLRVAPSPTRASWATSSLPGGDLPIAEIELSPSPTSLATVPTPHPARKGEPALLPTPTPTPTPTPEPGPAVGSSSDEARLPETPTPTDTTPTDLRSWNSPPDEPASVRPLSGTTSNDSAVDLETLSDLDLIRSLAARDSELTRQAEAALQRRGFRKMDLALAHQLASPDVAKCQQLAESVGRLPAGAGRWLIWLSQDPDSAVRKAAVSLMVTAQDPSVQQRLRIMENAEADEEVREQLQRWREMAK
ncbi:MAG: hypothetical protein ACYC3X_20935 [Pirellulaceae bacterium]